jgi:hypothetical protein
MMIKIAIPAFALVTLSACSPPPQSTLKECQAIAHQRGQGKGLTQADLGELTEACMADRGYALNRDSEQCRHDLDSETANRCYFRNDFIGRIGHQFSHL